MAVFYVFQGETYNLEKNGQYVWSPQKNKRGYNNIGYTTMTHVHQGDFILHNENGYIMAISIAKSDCFTANQPDELADAHTTVEWGLEGYRINCQYFPFDNPVPTAPMQQWFSENYDKGSAFAKNGRGKQQYMCHLADKHAIYILEKAFQQQTNPEVKKQIKAALSDIAGDIESEYDPLEKEKINELMDNAPQDERPEWPGGNEPQAMTTSPATGRPIPKRDPTTAAKALRHADYQCEFNQNDRTFLRKNGKPYTEPHHLIPISHYRDFNSSVDRMENIVSLCSHCHNLLHYGRMEDKKTILTKLYNDRKDALLACEINLTLEQLLSYYE